MLHGRLRAVQLSAALLRGPRRPAIRLLPPSPRSLPPPRQSARADPDTEVEDRHDPFAVLGPPRVGRSISGSTTFGSSTVRAASVSRRPEPLLAVRGRASRHEAWVRPQHPVGSDRDPRWPRGGRVMGRFPAVLAVGTDLGGGVGLEAGPAVVLPYDGGAFGGVSSWLKTDSPAGERPLLTRASFAQCLSRSRGRMSLDLAPSWTAPVVFVAGVTVADLTTGRRSDRRSLRA